MLRGGAKCVGVLTLRGGAKWMGVLMLRGGAKWMGVLTLWGGAKWMGVLNAAGRGEMDGHDCCKASISFVFLQLPYLVRSC